MRVKSARKVLGSRLLFCCVLLRWVMLEEVPFNLACAGSSGHAG